MTTDNTTPSYVLRYFDLIGLAETSRMLLTAAKVEWTEEHPEWPQEKPNQPFGHLPVLVEKNGADDGSDFILSESGSIERYLARTFKFVPTDLKEIARQEQLRDQQLDIILAFFIQLRMVDEAKKERRGEFDVLLDKIVEIHTTILRNNGDCGHLFGKELSYADMSAYAFYKLFVMYAVEFDADIRSFVKDKITPEILNLIRTVESDPLLEEHVVKKGSFVTHILPE
ncbi:hypothetical protein GGI01_003589 [Coemansia sp. RSA 376]|nr:hypothetical protein H4S03_006539 [Coemansia sp. S3946]KAJ2048014.1 hypothetical protein H4S04_004095 [Coemansia sp. S16]KAJ2059581.1 hypothetical protein GGI08_003211 [Coemansia sp. S2]KAJ2073038.1 hypothetical protein GGH13_002268 [Coemansia sp. S155-1]KAJ2111493.1 hypothetical protein IW146_005304 [Coemansia sp. RSA 922]KAJ2259513.1 hypothetical protein GGI01_003589 [Coemansia sp. RSA 376]KAJ2349150.1 hypothetical protein GGH92_002622 [Coemansia sp. RSA 2673]KAJ2465860.1 hypothetical p